MSKNECFCDCHNKDEKDSIILQLKNQIFEAEQKLNDLICVEEYNKQLKEENIKLIEEKNSLEYQLKQSHDFYEKNITEIRTENEVIKEDLENKKVINRQLYEENENFKFQIEKILNDYDYLKTGFEKLLGNNKVIQNENKEFICQIKKLGSVINFFSNITSI